MSVPPAAPFSPLVERAVELAAEWHEGTYRKGRWRPAPFAPPPEVEAAVALQIPVMAHVTAVALAVQRAGWDDTTVAAAFLHDALEDRNRWGVGLTREALEAEVGPAVVRLVEVVTEPKRGADGHLLPWRPRKETYVAQLAAGPPEAAAISLADKLHNAWTMAEALAAGVDIFADAPGRRALTAGPAEQAWFLRAVRAATAHHPDPRLDALRAQLGEEVVRFERAAGLRANAGG